ncbi:MAG: serine/threonine protein kinase [Planctomycetota bacterium]|jgi:serine/threonine protein kinase
MNRWQLIQELFETTLDLSPDERKRVLSERTTGFEDVIPEVEALIAADTSPFDSFDRGAGELLEQLREEADPKELCGQSFGHYEIEEHLSTGGMAHVYRAKRSTTDTERRVALKVMRPGIDTDLCHHRFGLERRILADLEHENIVSFLDAGEFPDGRPFMAMEFIEGVTITEWAANVTQRRSLEVFLRVLATVQYAHQRLVIHRDLKPSNVMISAQGMPMLLDFGVASILESDSGVQTTHEPLTPAYASPEQLRGESVSTASDVFSLGLLLHEVLCGCLPESRSELSNPKLDSSLRSILKKALAMDLRERYGSADQLAGDLERYLMDPLHL